MPNILRGTAAVDYFNRDQELKAKRKWAEKPAHLDPIVKVDRRDAATEKMFKQMWASGATSAEIQNALGIARTTVKNWVRELGLKPRTTGLPPEKVKQLLEEYKFTTNRKLAQKYGITMSAVASIAARNGVKK